MLKKWSCVSALAAMLCVQSLNARNIFVTSTDAANATVSLFTAEPLLFAGTVPASVGATQVIAGPEGKFYAIGTTAADAVIVLQGTFPALQIAKRIPLPGVPSYAVLSPDGRRLVVTHPGGVQIIDTASDNALTGTTGLNVGVGAPAAAISADSRRVFVTAQSARRVIVLNAENGASAGQITVEGEPISLSVGPNTLLYVGVQNAIYEYDPSNLELRGTFSLNGRPGPISFTPDGRLGIAVNNQLINGQVAGRSAYILDLARRTVSDVPIANGVGFTKVVVGDNSTAYAVSTQTNRIYFINLLSSGTAPALYNVSGPAIENVRDIALSNESPQAKSLIVLTAGELYRINVADNSVVGPLNAPPNGILSSAPGPFVGQASTLLPINSQQSLRPGTSSLPIRVRAVNSEGIPVTGLAVNFATEAVGVTLSNATATTDLLGYAQTVVSIPAGMASGVVTVNATASGQSIAFPLTVVSTNPNPNPEEPGPEPSLGGLEIVRGQGQVVSVNQPTNTPLTVRFRDPSGKPLPGVPVTWAITQGTGSLGTLASETDANGLATALFSNGLVQLGIPYASSVVSATASSQTVNFVVTTIPNLIGGGQGQATFLLRKPLDRVIVARVGETIPGAIEVAVGSLFGGGIPNVAIRLESQTEGGPTATCKDGFPLSNNAGVVTCDLIAGPIVGETDLRVLVGEIAPYNIRLRVEQGLAATVSVLAGNNQTGPTGQALPTNLSVRVTDAGGNVLRGVPVTWEVVSTGTATFTPATSTTDENGRANTRVTLGQQPGLVQVRARAGAGIATFSLTAQAAGSQLNVTGGGQSAAPGQAFANPVTVTLLNTQNQPIGGATVQFTVSSGSATVPATALTNASGVATINVTAGATPGPVVIRATYGSLSQNINLTVTQPGPVFSPASFVNGAGYQPGISPGGIAVISATGIARDVRGSVTPTSIIGPLPTSLAGVEVLFNGVLAPIYSVNNINGQESVIVQVPFETAPGNNPVTIRVAGAGSSTVQGVAIQAVKPAFFDFADSNSTRYVVALRPDGSYVTSANPARRGETVRVFATGLGQTTPVASTNRAGVRGQNVNAQVIAGINNAGVRLVSAQMAEGSVGVYIVEMEVPADTTPGEARPIAIAVAAPDGSLVYATGLIAIQ